MLSIGEAILFDKQADIYSLGIVLYCLITSNTDPNVTTDDIENNIIINNVKQILPNSVFIHNLLLLMLKIDPKERIDTYNLQKLLNNKIYSKIQIRSSKL